MYDLFGKYGAIRQIRTYVFKVLFELSRVAQPLCESGTANDTKGTAFVIYEDVFDAKNACEHLSGFNIMGRYLVVLYYQPNKMTKKKSMQAKKAELEEMRAIVNAQSA